MDKKTAEKAIRIMVACIADSNLTLRQIEELAEAFRYSTEFSERVGKILYELSTNIADNNRSRKTESVISNIERDRSFEKQENLDMLREIIKVERVQKGRILELLKKISPEKWNEVKLKNFSMNRILDRIEKMEKSSVIYELLGALMDIRNLDDEYLNGILKK